MRMSVYKVLIAVIFMQLVTTLKGVITALATLDTQAMDILARVSHFFYRIFITLVFSFSVDANKHASLTLNVINWA